MQKPNLKNLSHGLNLRRGSNHGWFHLKLYAMFQDLSQCSNETGFGGFETRLKFIKFGLWSLKTFDILDYDFYKSKSPILKNQRFTPSGWQDIKIRKFRTSLRYLIKMHCCILQQINDNNCKLHQMLCILANCR